MLKRFLPKRTCFFDFFEAHNALIIEACEKIVELSGNGVDAVAVCAKIKEIESRGDRITHECMSALHRSFITPFDRNDIRRLISRLDDILDLIEEAATCVNMYEIIEIKPEMLAFSRILLSASRSLGDTLKLLRDIRDPNPIIEKCELISKLEQEGDFILHSAMAKLFKEEKDTCMLIKWKEIFELLEKATDKCNDVTNTIEGIVIEAS
jgi:predicted phosphate transport protein (TIGR00153 family)